MLSQEYHSLISQERHSNTSTFNLKTPNRALNANTQVPYVQVQDNGDSFHAFVEDLRQWRQWLPQTQPYALCLAIDMLCVSTFSPGVMLYIFPKGSLVNMLGTKMKTDVFFALYNACTFMGEGVSRSLAYKDRNIRTRISYFQFLGCVNLVFKLRIPVGSAGFTISPTVRFNRACRNIDNVPVFQSNRSLVLVVLGDTGSVTEPT